MTAVPDWMHKPIAGARRRLAAPAGRGLALAAAAYLALSVALWWHVWTGHPTTSATCGCGDPAFTTWFLEWPAWAIAHGHAPWFSSASLFPKGMNLLSNTGMLGIGIPLAPITWAFGPVATLNVASTLAPFLSALAMYAFAGRLARRRSARFVAGLVFGFSSFLIANVAVGHLNLAMLPVPPLVAAQLHDLVTGRSRSPLRTGLLLSALLVVQFFISTEILVIVLFSSAVAVAVVTAYAALTDRALFLQRCRPVAKGLAACAAVTGTLLAVPTVYALTGPGHLSGRIWVDVGQFDTYRPVNYLTSSRSQTDWVDALRLRGYFGRTLADEVYIGPGLLAVFVAALAFWWRDGWVKLAALLGVVSAGLSFGLESAAWVPWRLLVNAPVLENVIQDRFVVVTLLSLGALTAVVVDRVAEAARRFAEGRSGDHHLAARLPILAALAVSAVALVPVVAEAVPTLPLSTSVIPLPDWVTSAAARATTTRDVLLLYPSFGGVQSTLAWQAIDDMRFDMADGSGPAAVPQRAGAEGPGEQVLSDLTFALFPAPDGSPSQLRDVRTALGGWRVTTVVVPNQVGPVLFGQGRSAPYAAGFFTAALGRLPIIEDDAWVWNDVASSPAPLQISRSTLLSCWKLATRDPADAEAAPRCVLAAAQDP